MLSGAGGPDTLAPMVDAAARPGELDPVELELGRCTADVVILTVLAEDYAAVVAGLRDPRLLRGSPAHPNTYAWQIGAIASTQYGGTFTVVVGKGTATGSFGALAARQAAQLFAPRYIMFVGVAGGFARDEQRAGDVVVSSVVVAYEYGAIDSGGFAARGDFTYRCDEGLVRNAGAAVATAARWWAGAPEADRPPRVRIGEIASGDKMIDDPDEAFFASVRARWPQLLAVETEGAGVAAAVHELHAEQRAIGFVLVRGISRLPQAARVESDRGTAREVSRATAADNAARFASHLIGTHWPVPPLSRDSTARTLDRAPRSTLAPAGLWRYALDRLVPRLHGWLRRIGAVTTPVEYADVTTCMRERRGQLESDVANRTKTYVPVHGRTVPRAPAAADEGVDPFVRPIHQVIRKVLGRSEGGDAVTAEIALVQRQSRTVRNLARTLRGADEPLILLGDPGSGKSMTLQRVACSMIDAELHRVFPVLTLYVPLGEFHVDGEVSHRDVLGHVRSTLAPEVARWLDALDHAGRLVIVFDGMDEMSRDRYSEHTEALSMFAGMRRGRTRTLFSCRITDFTPRFSHQRYVLVPFDHSQILSYLRDYFRPARALVIDGERWPLPRLARRLARGDQAVDGSNPFVLWLLCHHLHTMRQWPSSRMELLRSFLEKSYERKRPRHVTFGHGAPWPTYADCETALGELALLITERNLGRAIPVAEWLARAPHADVATIMTVGRTLGVLAGSSDGQQVRFDHHRLQEYFTALHLCRARPDIPWLDKLDVPRWQETMVNLVLLGRGDAAVEVLAAAVDSAVAAGRALWETDRSATSPASPTSVPEGAATSVPGTPPAPAAPAAPAADERALVASDGNQATESDHTASEPARATVTAQTARVEPQLGADDERLLADRAELAARITREPSGRPTTRARLLPVLRNAAEFLMKHGNPITQVKMMRAGVHLADPQLMTTLRQPLASKIVWVRAQALVLLAGDRRGAGVDLSSEIGFDLARGELLAHLPSYVRAVSRSRQPGAAWSLAVALIASALQLAFFLAIASQLYGDARTPQLLAQLFDIPTSRPASAAFIAIAAVAVASQLWQHGRYQVIATVGATLLLMLSAHHGPAVWHGEPGALLLWAVDGFKIAIGLVLLHPQLYAVQFLAILMVATLYGAMTRRVRTADTSAGPRALLGLWRVRHPASAALGILVLQVVIVAVKALDAGPAIETGAGVALFAISLIAGSAFLIAAAVAIGRYLLRRRSMKQWLQLVATLAVGGAVLMLLAAVFSVAVMSVTQLAEFVLTRHGRMLSETVVVALIVAVAWLSIRRLRWLYIWIRPRMFAPRSITPDDWQARLRAASAARQAELILRTDHQTLGLEPSSFLGLLEVIEPTITSEPALSAYWEHRAELEQVVRQQRRG